MITRRRESSFEGCRSGGSGLHRPLPLLFIIALAITAQLLFAPARAESRDASAAAQTIERVFSPEQTDQYVLDIEAAMARAQAAHGVIPKEAADEITKKADLRFAPLDEIAKERKIVQHRMVALVNVWRRAIDEQARQYVHYGATTVDIYDTALTLQLRRSALILIRRLRSIEAVLIKTALANQDAVMAGRTLGQHALPITFGKKVSVWTGENRRNIERLKGVLRELERSSILKGAVGTYAGLGDKAIEIEKSFATELGLPAPYPDDWHGSRDVYAHYALTLSLIGKAFGHIGQELFLLQMTDIGETEEPRDASSVSSSSMAQKVNPNKSEVLIQAARTIPRLAEVALDDVINFFERDNTSGPNATLGEISIKSEANLKVAEELLSELQVNRDAMRRNIDRTHGFIMAQRVVFALSAKLGKDAADKHIHALIQRATDEGKGFKAALLADQTVSGILTAADIDKLLEPEGYIGLAKEQIAAVISETEALRKTDPAD